MHWALHHWLESGGMAKGCSVVVLDLPVREGGRAMKVECRGRLIFWVPLAGLSFFF